MSAHRAAGAAGAADRRAEDCAFSQRATIRKFRRDPSKKAMLTRIHTFMGNLPPAGFCDNGSCHFLIVE